MDRHLRGDLAWHLNLEKKCYTKNMKGSSLLPWVFVAAFVIVSFLVIGSFFRNHPKIVQKMKPGGPISWESKGAPECPEPLILQTPVDINKVTSILYPGQERGGDFKPHGGFRFDSSKNDEIEVNVPMDAVVSDGSRYIEQGEVQYLFDFQTPCGIRYRFDHLLVLTPKFAKIGEGLPQPKEGDSRTTHLNPEVSVIQGEVIATAVGLIGSSNVFVDFGVYDMRGKGKFQNPRDSAICWFDLLPPEDAAKVKTLPPADSVSGAKSAYCK